MYRKYFPRAKTLRELDIINKKNKKSSILKFCNGFCQDYIPVTEFYPNDRHYPANLCRKCNKHRMNMQSEEEITNLDNLISSSKFVPKNNISEESGDDLPVSEVRVSLLDFPKITEELSSLRRELDESKSKLHKTEKKYLKLLEKRNYHKFEKGPALYVLEVYTNVYKVGFDDVNINSRFQTYRTLVPNVKVRYLVYTKQAKFLEQILLLKFSDKKLENNHEVLISLELDEIIDTVEKQISFLNLQVTVISEEEIGKYNKNL